MMRLRLFVASRAFCVNDSHCNVNNVTCSVRDNWTDLSCAIATSEVVIGVSVEFEALNLIA